MSDTDMTLQEAVNFLNVKRAGKGRPPKAWSEQKERAVAIVNAATADGKLNVTAGKVTASTPVAPVVTKSPEETEKDNKIIKDALATLPDTPTNVQW